MDANAAAGDEACDWGFRGTSWVALDTASVEAMLRDAHGDAWLAANHGHRKKTSAASGQQQHEQQQEQSSDDRAYRLNRHSMLLRGSDIPADPDHDGDESDDESEEDEEDEDASAAGAKKRKRSGSGSGEEEEDDGEQEDADEDEDEEEGSVVPVLDAPMRRRLLRRKGWQRYVVHVGHGSSGGAMSWSTADPLESLQRVELLAPPTVAPALEDIATRFTSSEQESGFENLCASGVAARCGDYGSSNDGRRHTGMLMSALVHCGVICTRKN